MFALFRFDLPRAVTEQLVEQLDEMKRSPLTDEELKKLAVYQTELAKIQMLPKMSQGVYVVYLADIAVYAGKADNLRGRLGDHQFKLSGRRNIDLSTIGFKCLLLEASWSTSANEFLLIEHYKSKGQCQWNLNGFGINDPGKNRDGSQPNLFDTEHPINEDWLVKDVNDKETVDDALSKLKRQLPFLLRYAVDKENGAKEVNLKKVDRTAKAIVQKVAQTLGPGWQAMQFRGYMTLYRANKPYEHGKQLNP